MARELKRTVILRKMSINRPNGERVNAQLDRLSRRALGRTLARRGWHAGRRKLRIERDGEGYRCDVTLSFVRHSERGFSEKASDKQFDRILHKLARSGRRLGWSVPALLAASTSPGVAEANSVGLLLQPDPAASLSRRFTWDDPEVRRHFDHIYDREPHIRIVLDAIDSAIASGFQQRHHCLLWGRPACGKTEILLAFERLLGRDMVMKLSAPQTSKAGAEKLLLERDAVPPFLLIEELEKCSPESLRWLLEVLDQRGEITKINAVIGSKRREAKCLCLATSNDLKQLEGVMSGALASRFPHKIYCPRPSRDVQSKILLREVKRFNGREEWIKPALDYCLDIERTSDPRRFSSILDGRDRLLEGSYQRDWIAVDEMMKQDLASELGGGLPDDR